MLQMIYQGLLVGIVAVFLYPYAITVLGSTQVAALSPAMPLLATLLGVFFLGENPSDLQWTGVAVVTIGLCVSQVGSYLVVKRSRGKT
jgi:drug/metabolite transporter (DMT)-like permease